MKIGFEQQSTIYPNKVLDGVAESLKQAYAIRSTIAVFRIKRKRGLENTLGHPF